ncbi:MAG: dephospho-CoA kinase, partial [Rhodospirillales bacterium]
LLFETGGEKRCDGVVTVSAPAFLQELRVLRRAGMTRERLESILARQMPDEEKRHRADFVVCTGLGRGFGLRQILNVVRIASRWKGTKWPPPPDLGGNAVA